MTVSPDPLSGRELAAFVAAVDAHTLYAAADALALTQSAVTKRIAALERRVGQRLLERGRTGVRPTAAGRALYPEARAALAALERARRAVADPGAGAALAVAASHTVAGYLLPGWLAGFRAERGTLRIAVEVVNSPGVLAAVREGRAELGFIEGIDALDGLESQMLSTDVLECVVRPGHRFARRRAIRPAELIDEPWIARESGSGTRAVAERALRASGDRARSRARGRQHRGTQAGRARRRVRAALAPGRRGGGRERLARGGSRLGPRPAARAARRQDCGPSRRRVAALGLARDPRTSPMMSAVAEHTELLSLAERAARAAGDLLRERLHAPTTGLAYKSSETDPVSDADRDAEAAIRGLAARCATR